MKTYFSLLLVCLFVGSASAQKSKPDSLSVQQWRELKRTEYDQWHWRISPYGWLPSIYGSVATPEGPEILPEPPPSLIDFEILFRNLRTHIKFLSVLTGEYRYNRFIGAFRFDALVLAAQPLPNLEPIFGRTTLDFGLYGVDGLAGYRVVNDDKSNLDIMGGLRFVHIKVGVQTTIGGSPAVDEEKAPDLDPLVAVRWRYMPSYRWEIAIYGDITPIPFDGNWSFQSVAVANYFFNPRFFLAPGYRIVGYRRTDIETLYFDGEVRGPYLRIGFQF